MNTHNTRTLGLPNFSDLRTCLWLVMMMVVFVSCGGGSNSEDGDIATDAEIVALCKEFSADIESSSSSDQLAAFEEVTQYVADYDYTTPDAPDDPPGYYTQEPSDSPHLYQMVGIMALFNGNRSAALWASLKEAQQVPSDPVFLCQVGTILVESERCDEATTFLRKAKHLDGDNELYRMSLASALSCQGKKTEAIAESQEAVALAPDSLLAKESLAQRYLSDLDSFQTARAEMYAVCVADIGAATKLLNTDAVRAFTSSKMGELSTINTDLMNMAMSTPMDFVEILMDALDAVDEDYDNRYTNNFVDPMDQAISDLSAYYEGQHETISITMGNCCDGTYPHDCSCLKNYALGLLSVVQNNTYPRAYAATKQFLPGSIVLSKDRELAILGEIVRLMGSLPDSTLDWTARYIYKLHTLRCKEMSLEVAYALQAAFTYHDVAEMSTDYGSSCDAATEEAARLAEMSSWSQTQADLQNQIAIAKTTAKDRAKKIALCLDGLGCLGMDGSKITVKIGGLAFTSFTYDMATGGVGCRFGVGVGDITGGNLWGADVSIGFDSSGSGLDVRLNQSYAAGTITDDTVLFKF